MSAHEDEVTGGVEVDVNNGNGEKSVEFSPGLINESIKASFEPLHAQISALTEIMDRLIHSNSVRETNTAKTHEDQYQYEPPAIGTSRTYFHWWRHLPPLDTRPIAATFFTPPTAPSVSTHVKVTSAAIKK